MTKARIALVGDRDDACTAHLALPLALGRVSQELAAEFEARWIGTAAVTGPSILEGYSGIWLVPKSPYESMEGALAAVRHARVNGIPFLGTCGGFQHALIEIARDVAGIADADHGETSPEGRSLIVSKLSCSLVDAKGTVHFARDSLLATAYGALIAHEGYHCSYGVNLSYKALLEGAGLRFTSWDGAGEARGAELPGHPFFAGVLFQPERAALENRTPPLVTAFVRSCLMRSA